MRLSASKFRTFQMEPLMTTITEHRTYSSRYHNAHVYLWAGVQFTQKKKENKTFVLLLSEKEKARERKSIERNRHILPCLSGVWSRATLGQGILGQHRYVDPVILDANYDYVAVVGIIVVIAVVVVYASDPRFTFCHATIVVAVASHWWCWHVFDLCDLGYLKVLLRS